MLHHWNRSCPCVVCSRLTVFSSAPLPTDDVEFEVSSDRRTGKPIAVKLLKIKPEVLPEERISGQVGPDLHAYPFTVLHGYIHPVKEHHFIFGSVLVCHLGIFLARCVFYLVIYFCGGI